MLRKFVPKGTRKGRKYPIKRDESGRSARRRAFELFDNGMRPAEVVRRVDISLQTAYRYFHDWKKVGGNLERQYQLARKIVKRPAGFSAKAISTLAEALGMAEEEVIERLQKPWGLKQLLMGGWPNPRLERLYSEQEELLAHAIKVVYFIEHAEISPGEITEWVVTLQELFRRHNRGQ